METTERVDPFGMPESYRYDQPIKLAARMMFRADAIGLMRGMSMQQVIEEAVDAYLRGATCPTCGKEVWEC